MPVGPTPLVEKAVFFLLNDYRSFVKYKMTIYVRAHFWFFYFIPLIHVPISVPVPCSFQHNYLVIWLDVRDSDSHRSFLVVEDGFCYSRSFVIPYEIAY